MPILHMLQLECVKQRDPVGFDEIDIYVTVDDDPEFHLSGPHILGTSKDTEIVKFHQDRFFNSEITVRLKERDGDRGGSNDRDLGTLPFDKDDKLSGEKKFSFTDGGVSYNLTCRLSDD